jgi:WD40 repeat protein
MRLSHAEYPRSNPFEQGETPGPEFSVAFSPDGRRIVTTGWDGTVRLWDLAGSATLSTQPATCVPNPPFTPAASATDAKAASLEVVRETKVVRVTETESGRTVLLKVEEPPRFQQGASKEAFKYLFSRNGRWLVVVNASFWSSGWLFVIDTTNFSARPVDLGGQWPIKRFVIGPNDERVYVVLGSDFWVKGHTLADKDLSDVDPGHVRAWFLESCTPATPPFEGSAGVHYLQFAPAGRQLIGGWEGWLRIWDAHTGKVLSQRIEHTQMITQRVFSADGRYLATASQDATARVWDALTGKPQTPPLVHRSATAGLFQRGVLAVTFNFDATWLASAGTDRRVRVWHISTGQPLGPELRVDFIPQTVAFDRVRQELEVTGTNERRQVFDLRPITTHAEDLALWAESLSAHRFDASEVLVMLGSQETNERLASVHDTPGLSQAPTRSQVLYWHLSRAALGSTWRGEDPSVRFHCRQIERIEADGEIWTDQRQAENVNHVDQSVGARE